MAEGDVQAGIEVLFKLVADLQSAQAQGVRAGAAIMAEIEKKGFKLHADPQGLRDAASQVDKTIGKAAEDVGNKLRLAFSAYGKAAELQTTFQGLRRELEAIAEASEKAGRTLQLTMKGPGMEGTYTLKGKQDVGAFISQIPQQAGASGSAGSKFTIGAQATVEWNDEMAKNVRTIHDSTETITKRNRAEEKTRTVLDMIKDFGQGMPPRRTFATMMTGGLMGTGM